MGRIRVVIIEGTEKREKNLPYLASLFRTNSMSIALHSNNFQQCNISYALKYFYVLYILA
jgi:hypothetical protein